MRGTDAGRTLATRGGAGFPSGCAVRWKPPFEALVRGIVDILAASRAGLFRFR